MNIDEDESTDVVMNTTEEGVPYFSSDDADKVIAQHFPFKDSNGNPLYRQHQHESIKKAVTTKKRFIVINAPVGYGKTVAAYTFGSAFNSGAYITHQKSLQEQILKEKWPGVASIKGANSYSCVFANETQVMQINREKLGEVRCGFDSETTQVLKCSPSGGLTGGADAAAQPIPSAPEYRGENYLKGKVNEIAADIAYHMSQACVSYANRGLSFSAATSVVGFNQDMTQSKMQEFLYQAYTDTIQTMTQRLMRQGDMKFDDAEKKAIESFKCPYAPYECPKKMAKALMVMSTIRVFNPDVYAIFRKFGIHESITNNRTLIIDEAHSIEEIVQRIHGFELQTDAFNNVLGVDISTLIKGGDYAINRFIQVFEEDVWPAYFLSFIINKIGHTAAAVLADFASKDGQEAAAAFIRNSSDSDNPDKFLAQSICNLIHYMVARSDESAAMKKRMESFDLLNDLILPSISKNLDGVDGYDDFGAKQFIAAKKSWMETPDLIESPLSQQFDTEEFRDVMLALRVTYKAGSILFKNSLNMLRNNVAEEWMYLFDKMKKVAPSLFKSSPFISNLKDGTGHTLFVTAMMSEVYEILSPNAMSLRFLYGNFVESRENGYGVPCLFASEFMRLSSSDYVDKSISTAKAIRESEGMNVIKVVPVRISNLMDSTFYRHADKILMMSGTWINRHALFSLYGIPEDDVEYIELSPIFDAARRPIIVLDHVNYMNFSQKASLSEKESELDLGAGRKAPSYSYQTAGGIRRWTADLKFEINTLRNLIATHTKVENANIILHVGTTMMRNMIMEYMDNLDENWLFQTPASMASRVMTNRHSGIEFPYISKDDLVEIMKSEPNTGKTLVTYSMNEGIDFKHGAARGQIIVKSPAPNFGDPYIFARCTGDESARIIPDRDYFERKILTSLTQQYGRVVRSDDDWGYTVIFDQKLKILLKQVCQKSRININKRDGLEYLITGIRMRHIGNVPHFNQPNNGRGK